MSLINDVLKNLQRPPQHHFNRENLLAGLHPHFSQEFHRNLKYYVAIVALLLIFIGICLYGTFHKKPHERVLALQNKPIMQAAQKYTQKDFSSSSLNPSLLTGIALQLEKETSNLRLLLNQDTFYRLSADAAKNELTIIFENTQLLAALPNIDYEGSGVEKISAFSDDNKNLKLVLNLRNHADLKKVDLNKEGKQPELQIDIAYNASLENPHTNTIPFNIKNPVAESTAEELYQNALALITNGQRLKATVMLKALLEEFPNQNKARESLINLLIDAGNKKDAIKIVNAGLEEQSDYIPFIELKAKLLVEDGKSKQALRLLEQSAPALKENPEYHAFIAALYQREGNLILAADLYKQLLSLDPNNGKWWLGLGVSLDEMGNKQQALEAYANARNSNDFNPELKAYIESRLSTAT